MGIVYIVLLLCAACFGLSGRVLERANMEPVPGAKVYIDGGADTVLTDAQGNFNLIVSTGVSLSPNDFPDVYVKGNRVFLQLENMGRVTISLFDSQGSVLNEYSLGRVEQGNHELVEVSELGGLSNIGVYFLKIKWEDQSRYYKLSRFSQRQNSLVLVNRTTELVHLKTATFAPGTLKIEKDKLVSKDTVYVSDDENLGDIVLDYPPRVLDVGAEPPYGAYVLFDGSQGHAAAEAELSNKWHKWAPNGQTWPQTSGPGMRFKIVPDPEHIGNDQYWTIQSCCHETWGYDDAVADSAHIDVQLHVEFNFLGEYDNDANPDNNDNDPKTSRLAGYNNSGVYIQSRYEVQLESVLSSNHGMGSLVDEFAPTTWAPMRPNGEWQAYDITFRAARWNGSTRLSHAYITVYWNGVKVHDNRLTQGLAAGLSNHSGEEIDPNVYGLKLQSEGTDVRFRNIWMKPLIITDTETDFGY